MSRRVPGVTRSRGRAPKTGVTERTRAVGYCRVSTDKQADAGHSLPVQRRKLEEYASLYDLELVDVVVDAGVSAKSLDRPGLQRALGMLKGGQADALLVVKFDRLTRSVRDLGELIDGWFGPGRWALLSVGDQVDTRSAAGRLVLNMLASVSQWEREAIGERTSAAMQHLASSGRHTGGSAPYGYALSACGLPRTICAARGACALPAAPHGLLEPVQSEQAVIAAARAAKARGLTLRAIAAELDAAGHKSRAGKPFASMQVSRMLDFEGPAPTLESTANPVLPPQSDTPSSESSETAAPHTLAYPESGRVS